MPNWCENRLIVSGEPKRLKEFDEAFKGRPALWPLQEYEKLGKTEEEQIELEMKYRKEWEEREPVYCFNALYPVPDEVLKVGYSVPPDENRTIDECHRSLYDPEKMERRLYMVCFTLGYEVGC